MPIQFITPSIISSVANTQVTGTITAGQLATSLNLATNNVQVSSIQSATGTPAITFAANGQMTLANTPLQLTGGQIKFPSTKIASADGNTLDDYEEGTWTPTYDGFTSSGAVTISGSYTKIGRMVRISASFKAATSLSGGVGGGTYLGGLPFTPSSEQSGATGYATATWCDLSSQTSLGNNVFAYGNAYPPTFSFNSSQTLFFTATYQV
jgi:hypothetical protein